MCGYYNPDKSLFKEYLKELIKAIQFYSKTYDNFMLIGEYNIQVDDTNMASSCEKYEFRSLINEPNCYKNLLNLSCIDLFLTNNVNNFRKKFVSETGLSDFHELIGTTMMSHISKQKPKNIKYRKYKHFDKNKFEKEILTIQNQETFKISEFI